MDKALSSFQDLISLGCIKYAACFASFANVERVSFMITALPHCLKESKSATFPLQGLISSIDCQSQFTGLQDPCLGSLCETHKLKDL